MTAAIKKLVVFFAATLVTLAVVALGLELWIGRTQPDPAVQARRAGRVGDQWIDLIHRASPIEGLAYELVPGFEGRHAGVGVRVNADGLRDDALHSPKPESLVRIAVLGDSTTFGFGVENDQTFAHQLELLLAAAAPERVVEVLNFGTSGYNTLDEALVLRAKALRYDPDFVIVGYNLNDPDIERVQPLHRFFAELAWWQDTHLYQWLARQAYERRIARYPTRFHYAHDPERANWRSVEEGFATIAELADEAGVAVLVALFPVGLCNAGYRFHALHEQVASAARERGLAVLDLFEAYAAADRAGEAYILPDLHPNPRGHAIAADALASWLLEHHVDLFRAR